MSETKQILFARNLICVCIDAGDSCDLKGKIWHQYSDEPIAFEGVSNMLIIMDDLYDEWDFPQRALEKRNFFAQKKEASIKNNEDTLVIDKIQRECGTRNIQNKRGKLGTFIVQVVYRQNASWQGHVVYAENNEKLDFDSEMELIKIIDSRISKRG